MVMLPDARLPEGLRVYAIGDVHGCAEALAEMHDRIERDLAARPPADWRLVHVGDYVDRGPQSREVLERLARRAEDPRVVSLLGNHDLYLLDFLEAPDMPGFDNWMRFGGVETIGSYGIECGPDPVFDARGRELLHRALSRAVPEAHRRFLNTRPLTAHLGDYLFVHAGVRPGVPLESQVRDDLAWIRGPFLDSTEDHGAVVVHGHTPVEAVEVRPNRIGIDTGAVFGGALTCLVLEGAARALLTAEGPVPLAEG